MNEKADWTHQLNIYAHLVEKVKKIPVTKMSIVAIIRDWSAREAQKDGYPQAPIVTIPIKVWYPEAREQFIQSRLTAHSSAMFEADTEGTLPECSPEEMWERETSYALKKEGNVRATSVHSSIDEARTALAAAEKSAKKNDKFVIEIRPGERVRCQSFCQVAKFCTQYKAFKSGMTGVHFPHEGDQHAETSDSGVLARGF
jgi:hypothetical protein